MYFKLAVNNIKKSYKDYLIYFLTITFGICLFYLFNSMESQKAMMVLDPIKSDALTMLNKSLSYVSFFMTIVLAFLMVYANQFLIKRRKKEIGIYMTLGMDRQKISFILVLETLMIGVISLIAGLIIGIFGSHFLSIITAKMFKVDMKSFQFIFSKSAFSKSVVNFSVIYLIMMVLNIFNITQVKLIDLLNANKKYEKRKLKDQKLSILIFIISIITLGVSYSFIIKNGMLSFDIYFKMSIFLGLLGTLLFFMSLSGILMDIFQTNKKFYLRNLNMFSLRQISSKVNSTYIMISILSILLLIAFGTFSTGMGIVSVVEKNQENALPFEMSLFQWIDEDSESLASYLDLDELGNYERIILKESPWLISDLNNQVSQLKGTKYQMISEYDLTVMSLTDYNLYAHQMKLEPITLNQSYAFITNMSDLKEIYEKGLNDLTLGSTTLNFDMLLEGFLQNEVVASNPGILVIEDQYLKDMPISSEVYNYTKLKYGLEETQSILEEKQASHFFLIYIKEQIIAESLGLRTIIAYIAIYVGLVFIMSCVVSLALQQLTEANDNVERYQLLRKLGVERKMVKQSLLVQISVYFFMPLGLAIIHAFVGIHVASSVVKIFGDLDIVNNIFVTALFAIVIYGSYFIITYVTSSSIVLKSK